MWSTIGRSIRSDYTKKRKGKSRVIGSIAIFNVYILRVSIRFAFAFARKDHIFPPERIELLRALSQKPDVYERLARAIAPSIYENVDIKKGILLQLFGGTKKTHSALGRQNFRSELHLLLCGDPGTSKSQLLQYVYNLVPRSQYTSGRGSSAVGLTAYVTKDPETRQLVLQT